MADRDQISTVTFDSYTTLVDVDSQATIIADRIDTIDNTTAAAISRVWRARNMMYSVIANDIDAYRPFYELQALSLRYALETFDYEVPPEVQDEIRRTVYKDEIAIFDDVRPAMKTIHDRGYDQYILSNGDPDMLAHMVDHAAIDDLVADTISADEIERFKPDRALYQHAAARTGTPIAQILHVSGGTMRDIWGANHAGMQTAWLNRPAKPYPEEHLGDPPDTTIESLEELPDLL